MDFLQHYWWVLALVVILVLAFVLLRPRQRVKLTRYRSRQLATDAPDALLA